MSAQALLPTEKTLVLIGFMGAGKTTVGRLLSRALKRPLVDLDEELEARAGVSIPEIFAHKGEGYFRDLETSLLEEYLSPKEPQILATGGGVVERERNRELLSQARTYYLQAPVEALWARLQGGGQANRPLAQERAAFLERFQKREPWYEAAGQVIEAASPPQAVATRILEAYLAAPDFFLMAEGKNCLIRAVVPRGQALNRLKELQSHRKIALLLDRAFLEEESFWRQTLPEALLLFPEKQGEAAKTLAEAERLLTLLAENRLDRADYLVARGGGALTDLGAFSAGLFKRGLSLILWPTTLLGAVDAAIGGKTAVNLAGAKNQVGHFFLPQEVWLEPEILGDLPASLLTEGLVEAVKTGLLFDQELLSLILDRLEAILRGDAPLVLEVARRSALAKARLVEKDFREEKGWRDVLNLGHTYGHVVESFNGPQVSHGQAVAVGLAVALDISRDYGLDPLLAERLMALCQRLGGDLPPLPGAAETRRLLTFDKKIRAGQLKFVILRAPGAPEVRADFDPDRLIQAGVTLAQRWVAASPIS
ncbi:MAG: hypothetical protein LBR11_06930 [Deltaproteobacteria bacterium]|jgi:shikimate kinase/3-dehydroquinate synthase|nr:hypothetical protein [Deltaproteobacteria bacterium]